MLKRLFGGKADAKGKQDFMDFTLRTPLPKHDPTYERVRGQRAARGNSFMGKLAIWFGIPIAILGGFIVFQEDDFPHILIAGIVLIVIGLLWKMRAAYLRHKFSE